MNEFKTWSELNPDANAELRPDLGFISFTDLNPTDRNKIWQNLYRKYFFDKQPRSGDYGRSDYYLIAGEHFQQELIKERILYAIDILNDKFKKQSYAKRFLESRTEYNLYKDFLALFMEGSENVVLEILSLYARQILQENVYPYRDQEESDIDYDKRKEEIRKNTFNEFAKDLNEVLSHFGIRFYLTSLGFAPIQDLKIIKEIYTPVLSSLAHPKWKEVNNHISDSFEEFRKYTPQGFSNCVTVAVSAVQAYLQILVNGKTGSGDISELIQQAQTKNLIPDDSFTKEIFKKIESVLMRERQETGIPHPKKEYANSKNALLVLNLTMVFFQHCLTN